jgi:hypothetical protein
VPAELVGFQELRDVMEVEVSAQGQWRPRDGGYPWTKITDPLPAPLPEQAQVI